MDTPPQLSRLAQRVHGLLKNSGSITVFEATTGGLINAALVSSTGASNYYVGGGIVYSQKGAKGLLPEDIVVKLTNPTNYSSPTNYIQSKQVFVTLVAQAMREKMNTVWAVAESGATGPSFLRGMKEYGGFTAIAVAGPDGYLKTKLISTGLADREKNMWHFTQAALDFLAECIEESRAKL